MQSKPEHTVRFATAGARPGLLRALNSLRFAAAAYVFAFHLLPVALHRGAQSSRWVEVAGQGYSGVPFFFVLSGLVLTHAYAGRLAEPGWAACRAFYVARIARIWPVHLVTLAAAVAIAVIPHVHAQLPGAREAPLSVLTQLTLTQSWTALGSLPYEFNTPAWSLSTEVAFYAVFPLLVWTIVRRRPRPRYLVYGIVLCVLYGYLQVLAGGDTTALDYFPLFRIKEFLIGMLIGVALLQSGPPSPSRAATARATALELVAVALVPTFVLVGLHVDEAVRKIVWFTPVMALVVWVFARERGLVSRALSWQPLVYLGDLSFGVYMWHTIVLRPLDTATVLPFATVAAIAIVVTLALSAATYHLVEQPARRAIRGRWERAPEAASAAQDVAA